MIQILIGLIFSQITWSQGLSTLRLGMVEEPSTLNPAFRSSTAEGIINALSVRSLAHFNSNSDLVPHLAKKAPFFKKNNLFFEIRENARWSDGTAVTCEDFKTSLEAVKKFRPSKDPYVKDIVWESQRPRSCKVVFNKPKTLYTLYLPQPLPTHLEKGLIEASANEVEYLKKTTYATNPTAMGLANGPFRLSVYKPGYYFELLRNPLFFGKPARFEKLQVRFFKNNQSLLNAYRSNEIDIVIDGLTSARAEEIDKLIKTSQLKGKILSRATTKLTHLEFNLERPSVQDIRVRRALSMMIDINEFEMLVGADGELTGSLPHMTDPTFLSEYAKPIFKLDRKQALKLLSESGYKKNSKGELVDKDKVPLEIHVLFNSENSDRERVAIYLENMWSSLGIKVHLKKHLKKVMLGELLKKGEFDVAIFGWSQPKLQINKGFFLSREIPRKENDWTGHNFSRWSNSAADKAIAQADLEFDLSKIKKHMTSFQHEFRQDLPWLPLYFERRFVAVPSELKGYKVFPDWEPETYEVENWMF